MLAFLSALCISLGIVTTVLWFLPQPPHWTAYSALRNISDSEIYIVAAVAVAAGILIWRQIDLHFSRKRETRESNKWQAGPYNKAAEAPIDKSTFINEVRAYRETQQTSNRQNESATTWTVALLCAAFLVGVLQWLTLDKTDATLRAEQRAWIAPRGAEISAPVTLGGTLEFQVTYENTGKEPAFKVAHENRIGTFDVPLDARGIAYWARWPIPDITDSICSVIESKKDVLIGRTAYPGQQYKDVAYIFTDPKGVPQEFLERKSTFWVQGCIAYKALGKFWFSPYCLYLFPVKDTPVDQWPFRFCPVGNQAKSPD